MPLYSQESMDFDFFFDFLTCWTVRLCAQWIVFTPFLFHILRYPALFPPSQNEENSPERHTCCFVWESQHPGLEVWYPFACEEQSFLSSEIRKMHHAAFCVTRASLCWRSVDSLCNGIEHVGLAVSNLSCAFLHFWCPALVAKRQF